MLSYNEFKKTAASGYGRGSDRQMQSGMGGPSSGMRPPKPVDNSKVYLSRDELPNTPLMNVYDDRFLERWLRGYKNNTARAIGATLFKARKVNKGGKDYVEYSFFGSPRSGGFVDRISPNNYYHSITIDPTRLPSHYFGQRLLEPTMAKMKRWGMSYDPAIVGLHDQPFNYEQIYAMETGDPSYLDKRIKTLEQVPEEDLERAGLSLSSPEEIKKWKGYVPKLNRSNDVSSGAYSSITGEVYLDPYNLYKDYKENVLKSNLTDLPQKSNESAEIFSGAMTYPASQASTLAHELRHQSTMGLWNRIFDPDKPISSTNVPSLMRMRDETLAQTPAQLMWSEDHAIEPYAVRDPEIVQALMSMNAGRYALKRDMQNDPDNPNYKQIKPEVLKKLQELPDFIEPGEKGKQQLDAMMQLFIENPELRALMPEQSRLVGYYSNLKAAIESSEDPEEKQYFQNLMDRFIYNKAFLANNQRQPRTSYTDAYRMMA